MVSLYVLFCLILSGTFIALVFVLTLVYFATRFKLVAEFSSGGEKK